MERAEAVRASNIKELYLSVCHLEAELMRLTAMAKAYQQFHRLQLDSGRLLAAANQILGTWRGAKNSNGLSVYRPFDEMTEVPLDEACQLGVLGEELCEELERVECERKKDMKQLGDFNVELDLICAFRKAHTHLVFCSGTERIADGLFNNPPNESSKAAEVR